MQFKRNFNTFWTTDQFVPQKKITYLNAAHEKYYKGPIKSKLFYFTALFIIMSEPTDLWKQASETFLLNDEPRLAMEDKNNNGAFTPFLG